MKKTNPPQTLKDLLIYAAERKLLPSQLAQNVKSALKQMGAKQRNLNGAK